MLKIIVIVSLIAAFLILLITKIGIRDYVIENAPSIISKLFNCDFCLSFWVSMLVSIIGGFIVKEPGLIIVPIFSTPITRTLI